MILRGVLFLLCLLISALGATRKPVTLDALSTPPPPSGSIEWAPDGKRFAYRTGGDIFLYDVASGARNRLVTLASLEETATPTEKAEAFDWQNRRVSEKGFTWSKSGETMLVTAGGDLFLVTVATGKWKQLTHTAASERDAKLSPDGRRVGYRIGQNLFAQDVGSGEVTRLTDDGSPTLLNGELDWVYPEELSIGTAWWWSPDSTRIAYLQFDISREIVFPQVDLLKNQALLEPERYPKAGTPNADVRLGVVAATGGRTIWMDLGETRDWLLARVDWLPASERIVVQRLNRIQNRLDLLSANPQTGESALVLREMDPFWINVRDDFYFFQDGRRMLWGSERSGYRHLYLYDLEKSKKPKALTSGEWEVTALTGVDEVGGWVYYISTQASPLERRLYRVRLTGGAPELLTPAAGVHSVSMAPHCAHYVDSQSSLKEPLARTVHTADGRQVGVYAEQNRRPLEEYEILAPEVITVKTSDRTTLYARLLKPAGFDPSRKYPAIVMVYGGPHAQDVRNQWNGLSWDQVLAHRGFVVWQLDNRGTSGRGHAFESVVHRNLGATELSDQKEGIRHLLSLGFVDPARLGIYGWSYGGYMTLYALTHAPDLFRAGIAGAPVTSWRLYDTIYTERYMGLPAANEEGYRTSSPQESAGQLKAELLLVHNYGDDNVHFQNTLQMADRLQRAGKQFSMLVYPQKSHGVTGKARRQMLEAMTAFFERHLANGPAPAGE